MTRFATALGLGLLMLLALTTSPEAGTFPVTTTSDDGPGSLRKAIGDAAASPGADTITFAIPGAGPHTISPTSGPFEIFDSGLTIDGTTQPGYAGLPLIAWTSGDLVWRFLLCSCSGSFAGSSSATPGAV